MNRAKTDGADKRNRKKAQGLSPRVLLIFRGREDEEKEVGGKPGT